MKIYVTYSADSASDGMGSIEAFDLKYWVLEDSAKDFCEKHNDSNPVFEKFVDFIYTED